MMRPGTVRTVGRVVGFKPSVLRPVARPVAMPVSAPVPVAPVPVFDDRMIPDANLPTEFVEGFLDITPDGHGYLRPKMLPSSKDVYISSSQIRRFNLGKGD